LWGALVVVAALAGEAPPPRLAASAPPAPAGCRDSLRAAGFQPKDWPLRPTKLPTGVVCEAPEGVALGQWKRQVRIAPPARVNCAFGLRLARFFEVAQEEAASILKSRVRAIEQLGTYNCRRMARFPDLVSEHSFANAIDVASFSLANGKRVVVEKDWVPKERPATTPAARFLRRLTRRLYDEQVFPVVLTPSYDAHHKNHLHLDGAAYTVDGT
jgi:hypothetical protein